MNTENEERRGNGSGGDIRPRPDPTALTTDAVQQAVRVSKDYTDGRVSVIVERLSGIDRATELLNSTVTRVPTEVQKEVAHLQGLMETQFSAVEDILQEKFASVQTQFSERDTRAERESRDNKIAVDAAFAAQKEVAAKQDESNARAIEKSERGFEKNLDALSDKIDDLKERLGAFETSYGNRVATLESRQVATREVQSDTHAGSERMVALIAVFVAVIAIIVSTVIAVAVTL